MSEYENKTNPMLSSPGGPAVGKWDGLIFALFNEDLWMDGVC